MQFAPDDIKLNFMFSLRQLIIQITPEVMISESQSSINFRHSVHGCVSECMCVSACVCSSNRRQSTTSVGFTPWMQLGIHFTWQLSLFVQIVKTMQSALYVGVCLRVCVLVIENQNNLHTSIDRQ